MNWDILDFAVAAALLGGVVVVFAFVVRRSTTPAYRFAIGVALAAALLLVWVNAAVGIIGNENNDANMMFLGVLAVGVIGALIARFRPGGMALALLATASAQILVAVIALIAGSGAAGPAWPMDVLVLTGFFSALWLLSAWLFRTAAVGKAEHLES